MKKTRPQCGLILENGNRQILLQLRDDKPTIAYSNCWGTFGGQIEPGETPRVAIVREIREELDYKLHAPEYFGMYPFDGYDIYMFRKVDPDLVLEQLTVREGQAARFFSRAETETLAYAFNCGTIVDDYFQKFP